MPHICYTDDFDPINALFLHLRDEKNPCFNDKITFSTACDAISPDVIGAPNMALRGGLNYHASALPVWNLLLHFCQLFSFFVHTGFIAATHVFQNKLFHRRFLSQWWHFYHLHSYNWTCLKYPDVQFRTLSRLPLRVTHLCPYLCVPLNKANCSLDLWLPPPIFKM